MDNRLRQASFVKPLPAEALQSGVAPAGVHPTLARQQRRHNGRFQKIFYRVLRFGPLALLQPESLVNSQKSAAAPLRVVLASRPKR